MSVNTTSGPHPSLRAHSGEVCEVQFLVERNCREADRRNRDGLTDEAWEAEPFAVWVEFPADKDPNPFCGGRQYTITRAALKELDQRFGLDDTPYGVTLCEHMGRLIE